MASCISYKTYRGYIISEYFPEPGQFGRPTNLAEQDMMEGRLRRAVGAVKDRTSIGVARVRSKHLEVAILKATTHGAAPTDEKYVHQILFLVCNSPGSVRALATGLAKRFHRTTSWTVALKGLMLIHRLLRGGDRNFEEELRDSRAQGLLNLTLPSNFGEDSSNSSRDFTAFLRGYSRFLDERMDWSITPAGRLESAGGYGLPGEEEVAGSNPVKSAERKLLEMVLVRVPKSQALLDRVMACRPDGMARSSRLVTMALNSVVRESFLVYSNVCEGLASLIDGFFDMQHRHCGRALEIYRKAASQSHQLGLYFDLCKAMDVCGSSAEYPPVDRICPEHLQTLEEFMKNRFESKPVAPDPRHGEFIRSGVDNGGTRSAGFSPERRNADGIDKSPGPVEDLGLALAPFPDLGIQKISTEWEDFTDRRVSGRDARGLDPQTCQAISANPGPDVEANSDPGRPAWNFGTNSDRHRAISANPGRDVDIDSDPGRRAWNFGTNSDRHRAISAKPGRDGDMDSDPGKEDSNFSCKSISGKEDSNFGRKSISGKEDWNFGRKSISGKGFWNFDADSDRKAFNGWELALVSIPGPAKSDSSAGFDDLLLESLYDRAEQGAKKFSSGSAPAEDPFAASANIPPPAYVQMDEMKRKQSYLVQEQQLWQRYQSEGMHGYCGLAQLYNSPSSCGPVSDVSNLGFYGPVPGSTVLPHYNMGGFAYH